MVSVLQEELAIAIVGGVETIVKISSVSIIAMERIMVNV